jgi:hypothetical protein
MEPIEVTARFDPSGKIYPIGLRRGEQSHLITDVGRRWRDEGGLHILVMLDGGLVWELLFRLEDTCWYLKRTPAVPGDPGFA